MTIFFVSIEFNFCCGISQSIFSLSRELKNRGHKIILGAPEGTMVNDYIKYGLDFVSIPIWPQQKNVNNIWTSIYRIRKVIKEHKVDVIHSHNRLADFFSLTANLLLNIPTVTTAHALISGNKKLSFRADKIIAVSSAIKKMLVHDFSVGTDRILFVRNIPRKLRIPGEYEIEVFKKNIGISKSDFIIAGIGRLHHEKGFDIFLKAIKNYNNVNAKAIIVGKGPEKDTLQEYVERNKLNAIFIDEISEVELIYSIANIIVIPSRQESAGLVAVEAALFKKPVIAANVGGLGETIRDDVSGVLVQPENWEELSAAIENLFNNKEIAAERGKELYYQVTKEYDSSHITDQVESLYMQLIATDEDRNHS